jgi:hypothetical protein
MTSMSSSGYGGDFGQHPGDPSGFVEQRTSVMAILSLVFALICFIPGFALLGVIFGVASLVAIARSGDRLTGRGLAIAGLILSFIVLAVQAGITIGASRFWGFFQANFVIPYDQTMNAIETGDNAGARKLLSAEASKRISDADIDAFRTEYQGELGHFTGVPNTPMSFFQGYGALGQQMQQFQGRNDAFPMPGKFDKGMSLIVFQFDPQGPAASSNKQMPPIVNIMVVGPTGTKWTLYDPQRAGGGAGATPDKSGNPTEKPKSTEPPKTDTPNTPSTPKEPDKPGPG